MKSRISLEHITFYQTEIDVVFTIQLKTGLTETRYIKLDRHQFQDSSNSMIQPIVQKAHLLFVEQLRELNLELETLAPFDDDILWTSDVTNPSTD